MGPTVCLLIGLIFFLALSVPQVMLSPLPIWNLTQSGAPLSGHERCHDSLCLPTEHRYPARPRHLLQLLLGKQSPSAGTGATENRLMWSVFDQLQCVKHPLPYVDDSVNCLTSHDSKDSFCDCGEWVTSLPLSSAAIGSVKTCTSPSATPIG